MTFEEYESIVAELRTMVGWNDFAASLVSQHDRNRSLSEKQISAAKRMIEKVRANKAARDNAPTVDLSPIKAMFDAAVESGYKRPTYRAAGIVISRASDMSRNPGCLYIKADERDDEGERPYLGKVTTDQKFVGKPQAMTALAEIAKDPHGAAVAYGRRTGRCACCGRELTNHGSIDRGIGPICAERWGFA